MTLGRVQDGLTYPVVLGMLLVMSVSTMVTVEKTSTRVRRDKEAELLFRGMAYRQAIRSFYRAVPEAPRYPSSLEDLLLDPRFPHRRHLRRAYEDPVSGEDWLLIQAPGGDIAGVASASRQTPIKSGNFPQGLESFALASSYRDWQFLYLPGKRQ